MSHAMTMFSMRGVSLLFVCLAVLFGGASAQAGTYQLTIEKAPVRIHGKMVEKLTINGGVPGPTLRFKEGEQATITVTNKTDEDTSVHWHGILLPGIMDGSPGFNGFLGIKPGQSYTYTFNIRQSGTYWYHSHSGTQDQSVLGALVIDPIKPHPVAFDREYVLLFGDATPEDSDRVLRNLKADPGFYNYNKRTIIDFFRDAQRDGVGAAVRDRLDWGDMRMDPTDLADVTGYAFQVNGKEPQDNETLLFKKGERVRLRFINGSAMSFFDVRVPGLKMLVVAADGNDVSPVPVDEIRMGVAERYDVIVEPLEDIPYTVFAESLDRQGYARATLATAPGQEGPIPAPRPRTLLNMADMGMSMPGMDHSAMGHDMSGMDMSGMDMSGMDMGAGSPERPLGWAAGAPPGTKILTYRDLKRIAPNADNRPPERTIKVRLSGNMERYMWTLNDKRFGEDTAIRVKYGERVRLTFVNETMMAHPVHLHGMFFELENGSKDRRPMKDTVTVAPGQEYSVILTAKEVGGWPLHCHLLYHMVSGMMTTFIVEPPGATAQDLTPDGATLSVPINQVLHGQTGHSGHGGHP
jgi:FtsP/CotA-like multicopper oxidase with cupredoxin domain